MYVARRALVFSLTAALLDSAVAAVPVVRNGTGKVPLMRPLDVTAAFFALAHGPDAVALLNGREVDLPGGVEFVKLNIGFAAQSRIRSVSLESCKGEFSDGIDFMFHPGARRAFVEGGKRQLRIKVPDDRAVSAISIVFNHQAPPCLKNIEFLSPEGRKYLLKVPTRMPVQFESSSASNLFDLDFGKSFELAPDQTTVIEFSTDQQIDRLQIWPSEGSRSTNEPLRFTFAADLHPPQTIELKAKPTAQTIELLPPLKGKRFVFKAITKVQLAELRFGSGSGAEAQFSIPTSDNTENEATDAFAKADLSGVLDRELTTRGETRPWHFRFRSNSSFFVYGYNESDTRRGQVSGLGHFEIVETSEKKIKLRLKGTRIETGGLWDGWICGAACGESALRTTRPIDEMVVIERIAGGYYMIRNRTPSLKRALLFGDLKSKVSTLSE